MKDPDCASCQTQHDENSCGGHWRPARGFPQARVPRMSLDVYDAAHLADSSRYDYEERT